MLLNIEALLLISAALLQDPRAVVDGQIYPLDMAPNSVDDQYDGCAANMRDLEMVFLQKELSESAEYNKTWQEGVKNATKPEDNLQKIHTVAIHVYTNKDSSVYRNLTAATRSEKQGYTEGTFRWYSLHFLLTEAIQILSKSQNRCFVTYRGTNLKFEAQSQEVRLSSFSSSSLDRKVIQGFGNVSCFEIYTCEGANLTKYSKYPEEKEVLIPPYETFNITAIKTKANQTDLWCDTVFVLNSTGKRSNLNCALFNSGNQATVFNILLILQVIACNIFTG